MTDVVKRCSVCGKFRAYYADDKHCIGCGADALEPQCTCGRTFEFALSETGDLYCPRCGRGLRGRAQEFEP
jgi:hypothetical protein